MGLNVCIIGAGQFGGAVAKELAAHGAALTLVDRDAERVEELRLQGFNALALDAADESALRRSGALAADVVIVSTGESVQAGIYAALLLKHLKAPRVLACASDEKCARLLEHIGAEVIRPSKQAARDLVKQLLPVARR